MKRNAVRWRSWAVPTAGMLLLASSYTPWWVTSTRTNGYAHPPTMMSVWHASRPWAVAVAFSLGLVGVWISWRLAGRMVPDWLRGLLILASVAPTVLAVNHWRTVRHLPPTVSVPGGVFYLVPGHPISEHDPHILVLLRSLLQFPTRALNPGPVTLTFQGPGWGVYAGFGCLVLVTVAFLVAGTPGPARPNGDGAQP